ncbi:formate dehydrogenase accessory sulfurtransferase FdhD [Pseudoxanthomonas koreensis]|uniref:formate dehydrogenase accessory sulfurtransferase FdhD n=1 Tax=Pseudoxanthomonas koreensis TaxID=266061 RepID=UPI001391088C|nr:formate dehydrogenase accessory sulfurtransferase FdhD [Pseudoxanthomonas koreensis]KAF1689884.1 sulfurtransferase FdhD [Pseudoxanthomonas koreensis]
MSESSSRHGEDTASAVPGSTRRTVVRRRGAATRMLDDAVAEEVPVAFVYNDAPFAVMMATPGDFVDFATGFSLSEGIVDSVDEVAVESVAQLVEGWEVRLRIPEARAAALERRRRSLSGRSGCGICGSELLEAAMRWPQPVGAGIAITDAALHAALHGLKAGQQLAGATGATHAATWADAHGTIVLLREDVGRHNALDKLVGAMARAGIDPQSGFAVATSRASYEMAMKAASAGIGLLAAVSAPTALAITLAERANLTLVGFAREDGYAVYSHPWRLGEAGSP